MKRIATILIAVIYIITMSSCSSINEYDETWVNTEQLLEINYPVTIEDITFKEAPSAVVSLSPAITDMLNAFGLGEKVIGISEYCTMPENSSAVCVGSPAFPDIEAIVSLKPDVLLTQSPLALTDLNYLDENGIIVIYKPVPQSVVEFVDYYAMISLLFFGNSFSNDKTTEVLSEFDSSLSLASSEKTDITFLYIETDFLAVATDDTLAGDILSAFGKNTASGKMNMEMSIEEISEADPDILFLSDDMDTEALPDEIKQLNAYVNGNIIYLDRSLLEMPTVRLAELIDKISSEISAITSQTVAE